MATKYTSIRRKKSKPVDSRDVSCSAVKKRKTIGP